MTESDEIIWTLHVVDALPLIIEKFNVTEREAFGLWLDHQPKNQPGPDVINMDTDEKRREARERLTKPGIAKFSFKSGKRLDNDNGE
jgi:hypothetical protein